MNLASPAEIIRAFNKDKGLVDQLQGFVYDILRQVSNRISKLSFTRFSEEVLLLSNIIYFLLTSIANRTFGEQISNIYQISKTNLKAPSAYKTICLIALSLIPDYVIQKLIRKFLPKMKSKKIIITLLTTSFITSNLLRLNMVIFFWKQKYFTLSHRITGIKYISTEANSRSPNPENFQFLIKLILLQILASILTSISQLRNIQEFTSCDDPIEIENCESITSKFPSIHDKLTQNTWLENYIQCLLCYSPCLDPSACPCGHIYCWSCITKWSFEHLSCPTCRSSCLPQELIKLR